MKGQKIYWQMIPLLLASAALSFGQLGMPMPQAPGYGTSGQGPAAPSEPVRPGTINYVEGQVSLDGQNLTPRAIGMATLNPGEVLDTGAGYAEILLTPGAFLRVGNSSEVRMLSAGLADTRTELVHGASILEVDQMIKGTHLAMVLNGTTTEIAKNGLYEFDAAGQAVMVLDGQARIQEASGNRTLDKHDEVLLASQRPLKKRSFNEQAVKMQPLYVWSKARSEDEAEASVSAARNADLYAAAGPGWYWDPAWDFYGFWPAADALYSPFGWGFYSPALFGFGYYGGGYLGGGWYGYRGWTGRHPGSGWHGRVGGINARARGFGSGGGFHGGMGGGFHGGGGGRR
ncbi:MAG: hypothetical protein WB992_18700 [Bryobacteraceae bacterium]